MSIASGTDAIAARKATSTSWSGFALSSSSQKAGKVVGFHCFHAHAVERSLRHVKKRFGITRGLDHPFTEAGDAECFADFYHDQVVFGIVGVVPNGAECFFGETRGRVREVPFLIPNRQEVDEVLNLRHAFGRKASNLLNQGFFGHLRSLAIVAQAFTLPEARRFGGARERSGRRESRGDVLTLRQRFRIPLQRICRFRSVGRPQRSLEKATFAQAAQVLSYGRQTPLSPPL